MGRPKKDKPVHPNKLNPPRPEGPPNAPPNIIKRPQDEPWNEPGIPDLLFCLRYVHHCNLNTTEIPMGKIKPFRAIKRNDPEKFLAMLKEAEDAWAVVKPVTRDSQAPKPGEVEAVIRDDNTEIVCARIEKWLIEHRELAEYKTRWSREVVKKPPAEPGGATAGGSGAS